MEITIRLDGVNYRIPEEKIESLKQWMRDNHIMTQPGPAEEELIVDIETTKGLEIEFDETKDKVEETEAEDEDDIISEIEHYH